jgi:hypothetical protein
MNAVAEGVVQGGGLGTEWMIFHNLEPAALRPKLEQEAGAGFTSTLSQAIEGQGDNKAKAFKGLADPSK